MEEVLLDWVLKKGYNLDSRKRAKTEVVWLDGQKHWPGTEKTWVSISLDGPLPPGLQSLLQGSGEDQMGDWIWKPFKNHEDKL